MRLPIPWRWRASDQPDCRHVGAWLQSYLDGELDDVRSRAVRSHLKDCSRCGMEAATYRQLKASLRRQAAPPPQTAESIQRLRRFAEQLAQGGIDAHGGADLP